MTAQAFSFLCIIRPLSVDSLNGGLTDVMKKIPLAYIKKGRTPVYDQKDFGAKGLYIIQRRRCINTQAFFYHIPLAKFWL